MVSLGLLGTRVVEKDLAELNFGFMQDGRRSETDQYGIIFVTISKKGSLIWTLKYKRSQKRKRFVFVKD